MDELFDLFDTVTSLDAFSDLADHSATLLDALQGLDYVNLDGDDLATLDELITFDLSDVTDFASAPDNLSELSETSLGDWLADSSNPAVGDLGANVDFAYLDGLGAGDMAQYIVDDLGEYPEGMLEGLHDVSYDANADPEHANLAGMWTENDEGASIKLFDHQENLPLTLHHELAHHLMASDPALLEVITPHIEGSPLVNCLDVDLTAYPSSQQADEFAADAFSFFKVKPSLLEQIDPELYEAIAGWWERQTSST